jgi:anti-sigma-K factor RskA
MEANALHDLTAAYALDALEPADARAYEAHLARCGRCRDELASFSEAASALAYGVEAPAPPPHLRERILERARSERPNVVPLRPRWAYAAAAVAAVAACAAIAFGIWAASLSGKLDRKNDALAQSVARQERVAQLLAREDSKIIPYAHGTIALVVTGTGDAALVLRDLPDPGSDLTYEAWVANAGKPEPAGLFRGGRVVAVPLEQAVRRGATVMVTKEPKGGRSTPSEKPFIVVPYRGAQS